MPVTKEAIRRLTISYTSAIVIIVLLLLSAQGLIQFALNREQHERSVASQINEQELRTERMFRNVILLQNPAPGTNYKQIASAIEEDDLLWERTQDALYGSDTALGLSSSDFGASATAVLAKAKTPYTTMRSALNRIFRMEDASQTGALPDAVRPDVGVFFVAEPSYLQALIAVYGDFAAQADSQVETVRIAEITLCLLTLFVLLSEWLLVIRPATRYLKDSLIKLPI